MCETTTGYLKLPNLATQISYYNTFTDEQLLNQLITYGPIVVGVGAANSNFMYVSSTGLVDGCPSSVAIDHAVLLYGYN